MCFTVVSCLAYCLTLKEVTCSSQRSVSFSEVDGIMSQKIKLLVRTSKEAFRNQDCEKQNLRGLSPQSKLYQPRDRRMSAKLVPTFVDRGCHVVSMTNPYGRNLIFLGRHPRL
jgi:hypothetical protein